MTPSWRKPFGMLLIVTIIVVWCVIIASASASIGTLPALLQAPIYLAAGIVWILPLKPLLRWMETGKWRE
ncbi:DUF2842 domain-containing protein [Parasphingopyxis lamellibrachiae]|uniref:Uncharacterized protein DUF2842 n=1 Tax=Parasphingopyxis lamellibrachiae TaxID=680125 RepID=A0A3D9FE74_9SPHN|nr:DUF2842 domain-containing protein [Parasphingopyxis lamellibrachiae]RED15346.1 uncharacterized protein DUF2842 [Parasphingopyxis lamellibrachiae]